MLLLKFRRARRWILVGDKARDTRDWASAAKAYNHVLRIRPDLTHIWIQYGHMLKEAGSLVDAELAYRQALTRDRFNGDAFLQLGHALKLQGRLPEALDAYRHAYIVDAEAPDTQEELKSQNIDISKILSIPSKFL